MVLDLNLDEIAVLKKEVVELRDADPFGEHFDINPNAAKAK
jgi:hypothetical protein